MGTHKIEDTGKRKNGKTEIQASGIYKEVERTEKESDEKLEAKIDIRLSTEEKKQIIAYVLKLNARKKISQSKAVRKLILEGIMKSENGGSTDHERQCSKKQESKNENQILNKLNEMLIETQRIGRNLNQCTKALSSNLPPEAMAKYTPALLTGIENTDVLISLIKEWKQEFDPTS